MFKLIKRLLRWVLYLIILAVALIVAAFLLRDTIVKQVMQNRLRSATGMDVRIGKMDIGLATPTIAMEDVRIYNPPGFGGSLFLSLPEIYVDYDLAAIRARKLHLNLVRLNLEEMDIVQDKQGRLNIQGIAEKSRAASEEARKQPSAFTFAGLDTLNVTFQKLRRWNLDTPDRVEERMFGITNEVFTNLKTKEDWRFMAKKLAARCSASDSSPANAPMDLEELLQQLSPPGTKKL
jgi:hypothetical protein